jgi:hypothetical protein
VLERIVVVARHGPGLDTQLPQLSCEVRNLGACIGKLGLEALDMAPSNGDTRYAVCGLADGVVLFARRASSWLGVTSYLANLCLKSAAAQRGTQ